MVLHIEDVEGNKSSVQRMWPNSQEPNTSVEVVERPPRAGGMCPDVQLDGRVQYSQAE